MSFYLRKDKKAKGIYLQMYEVNWDKELNRPRNKCVKSFGYVNDLISDDMPDPIAYYKDYVAKLNQKRIDDFDDATRPRAFNTCVEKNIGYFLLSSLIDELGVKDDIDILAYPRRFQFSLSDMIFQLIYSRVLAPCSKSKTVSSVFPTLYEYSDISEDQVYDGLFYIGEWYEKYIEMFNYYYNKHYKRNYDKVYFDCTNYYFEIDLPKNDQQKGPSKENQHSPIIGQALLLDADLIPLAMQMYPGNESEKPYIRKTIENMKQKYDVNGRTIQVADKGLNCARNIYAAVVEANDGYIFSKSVHGKNLSKKEKEWVRLENENNVFTDYCDENGKLLYRIKSCIDTFTYEFKEVDSETQEEKIISFKVKEKRIVSYNPALAEKQQAEIQKMVDKAANYASYKNLTKEEIGDSAKYVKITTKDKNGKKVTPKVEINEDAIREDMDFAGYNLIVTSELKMQPNEIYQTYHNLWKIEESFRITKSYLDARPVYVQKPETIYGHFLICYLSLFLLRVLEIKCFKNKVNTYDIINFIRDLNVVNRNDGVYINLARNKKANWKIKDVTGLTNLDALYLKKKEIDNLFKNTMLINS